LNLLGCADTDFSAGNADPEASSTLHEYSRCLEETVPSHRVTKAELARSSAELRWTALSVAPKIVTSGTTDLDTATLVDADPQEEKKLHSFKLTTYEAPVCSTDAGATTLPADIGPSPAM
jgi:hypothetical protein